MTETADFAYPLPRRAVAQTPADPRDAARMLVDRGPERSPLHSHVRDLPEHVGPGDLVVVNDSRVLPARLRLRKVTGGAVEVLLLERGPESGTWDALVRPSRRVPPGTELVTGDLRVRVGEHLDGGRRRVTLDPGPATDEEVALARHGEIPLPPYITETLADAERYQTVYADRAGSVAAPTAGLHLTSEVLDRCRAAGAEVASVELRVGLGTFRPIEVDRIEDHTMHAESYRVPERTRGAVETARRVVAVGTTTLRALETSATTGQDEGRTDLYVHGDHPFRTVDVLLTNFHVPRSSLLVLVDAFIGPRWRRLYSEALIEGYRFLSFGDCCLLDRRWGRAWRD